MAHDVHEGQDVRRSSHATAALLEDSLVEAAPLAYRVACREVFDTPPPAHMSFNERHREVLGDLEAAEQAMRRFREQRHLEAAGRGDTC
jgi:hypothetical protein